MGLYLLALRSKQQSCVKEEDPTQTERTETGSVMEIYEPFLLDGFVSLDSDYTQSTYQIKQLKSYEIPELLNPLF